MDDMQTSLFEDEKEFKIKAIQVRLTPKEYAKLNDVSKFYGVTNSKLIRRFINIEFDNIKGHPELKELMDKYKELNKFISKFNLNSQ